MKDIYRRLIIIVGMFLYMFPLTPVMSQGLDIGTKFGPSLVYDIDENIASFSVPSSVPSFGTSLPSLYATFYPIEYLGITCEGSYGYSSDSGYIYSVGIGLSGLLYGFTSSTPYISGDVSFSGLSSSKYEELSLIGVGGGAGYLFNIDSKFTCGLEARYRYLINPDDGSRGHKISLVVSIGTLFSD